MTTKSNPSTPANTTEVSAATRTNSTAGAAAYAGWPEELRSDTQKKRRRKKYEFPDELGHISITSLADIVTIILVYMLKTFTSNPIEVKEAAVSLPVSSSREIAEDALVVMVTGPQKIALMDIHDPKSGKIVPNTPKIIVDGRPILELDASTYRIRDTDKDSQTGGYVIDGLRAELVRARKNQEGLAKGAGKQFTGKVAIVADRQTPYRVLMDILITCGEAGFGEFKFAIIKEEE